MNKFALAVMGAVLAANAMAAPSVSYSVSGVSGNYVLDFSVTNNMLGTDQDIYFFGVSLSNRDIVASPGAFDPNAWTTWNNAVYGGNGTTYNNNWLDITFSSLTPGNTLSGFQVHSTDVAAPTSVSYFMFGATFTGTPYLGGDNFFSNTNPGFEGVAQAVPEPMTMAALGLGFAAVLRRRRK